MNIFNIPSNYSFLKSLAKFVQDKFANNQLTLSNLTILLPSRRSCNELKRIFLDQTQDNAIILPQIKAIGDIDYDDITLQQLSFDYLEKFNEIAKPVSTIKYKIFLIKKILEWSKTQNSHFRDLSAEQASILATELDRFLNEVKKEGVLWDNLQNLQDIAEEESAEHWQKILEFFNQFGKEWNGFLKKQDIVSIYDYRIKMIELNAEFFNNNEPAYPLIIAGSNGTVHATSELIKTVLKYDNCYVILKGLDKNLDEDTWQKNDTLHPQTKFKKLLAHLNIQRTAIQDISYNQFRFVDDSIAQMASLAMLPANETDRWQEKLDFNIAPTNLSQIQCADNFEEMEVITILLRNYIENQNRSVALITNDEDFGHQIELRLKKWNIEVNNSFGDKLMDTRVANYLQLLANTIIDEFSATTLLSLLKHPFTLANYERETFDKLVVLFEDFILREKSNTKGFTSFYENLKKTPSDNLEEKERYKLYISEQDKTDLWSFLQNLEQILMPLSKQFANQITLEQALKTHITVAEKLASNKAINGKQILWSQDKGSEELYKFFEELIEESQNYGIMASKDYPALLNYFMTGRSFHKKYHIHPTINILSPIEARLIDYDLFIVANLNEGKFPAHTATDPWMSKSMRVKFGLSPKEEIISTYAYDFTQYISQKQVILTRAIKENGIASSKSRFLQRLETFLKCQNLEMPTNTIWIEAVKSYNQPTENIKIPRPAPTPPLGKRPKKLSATRIETLLRNPYEIYAQKILGLYKKPGIDEEDTFAVFGNAVHKTLEDFVENYNKIEGDKFEYFMTIGNKYFDEYFIDEINKELWRPRLKNIAKWFVANEDKTQKRKAEIFVEQTGETQLPNCNFTVSAKADRIEIDEQGNVSIIDYKTGNAPSKTKVQQGIKPQLSIEAYILKNGGFIGIKKRITNIDKLEYWEIKGKNKIPKVVTLSAKESINDINQATKNGLIKLVLHFANPTNPYIASAQINDEFNKEGKDYLHLSRSEEWTA